MITDTVDWFYRYDDAERRHLAEVRATINGWDVRVRRTVTGPWSATASSAERGEVVLRGVGGSDLQVALADAESGATALDHGMDREEEWDEDGGEVG